MTSHTRYPTESINADLLEVQSRQISPQSNLKQHSLGLFRRGLPQQGQENENGSEQ